MARRSWFVCPVIGRAVLRPALVPMIALTLMVGCGDNNTAATTTDASSSSTDDANDPANGTAPTPDASADSEGGPSDTATGGPSDTATGGPSDTATGGPSDTATGELPGEPWDGFADAGDELAVVGVAFDDVLNVRSVPGNDGDIIATLPPDGSVEATGQARLLPSSAWYEVNATSPEGQPVTGWVAVSFVAFAGGTDDATAEFLDGGPLPEAVTITALAELVAQGFASADPPSSIVQVVETAEGDDSSLAEVTYDVIGLGDDAAAGYRLHIFATNDGDGLTLKTIERTVFCSRGLAGEGCL